MGAANDGTAQVDAFLAAVAEPARSALQTLRSQINAATPGAEELINYGVPMVRLGGRNLVSFGAARAHCSFYVQSPAVMEQFAGDLAGFDTTKGSIHFTPDKPIPAALIRRIVEARIAENAAAPKGKAT